MPAQHKNPNDYVNHIVAFNHNGLSYFALCIAISKSGELIAYRARQKPKPKFSREIAVEDSSGQYMGYTVEFKCKFLLHPDWIAKKQLLCDAPYIDKVNALYDSLPPLEDLIKRYKEAKSLLPHLENKTTKQLRNEANVLAQEIAARQPLFLQETKQKKEPYNKYRNFRLTPDKNGVSRMYKGGGCSGK